jgi:D-tyrosyl-tRNA(Tyr) deacylase
MRILIQRVSRASVTVEKQLCGKIGDGLLVLAGFETTDTEADLEWMAAKICGLRIFSDTEGKMNLSLMETNGELLLVSQFTLHAQTAKGNRPSFIRAARPEVAIPLYETFRKLLEQKLGKPIATGQFGADMQVELLNNGPVTIWIDSKNKE